jgi:hypothetical protein
MPVIWVYVCTLQMVWWGIGGNVTPVACRLAKRPGLGGVQDYQRVKFTYTLMGIVIGSGIGKFHLGCAMSSISSG